MPFIFLTFMAALFLEGLGSLVSVIGVSALFGANPIIISFAIALDVSKIVVVSLLYSYWAAMGRTMKSIALVMALITMIITSAGAAGYLSGEFQKAMMGTQETSLKVDVLKQQQAKYEERKRQIDDQIANLPEKTTVNQRLRLMNGFKQEQADLQAKINQIDKELPDLQMKQIGVQAKAGPILVIAKSFDIPVEQAVKYVIALMIVVFDPLAVFLIIAGNFLIAQRKKKLTIEVPPPATADVIKHEAPLPAESKMVVPAMASPEPIQPVMVDEPAPLVEQGLEANVEAPVQNNADEPSPETREIHNKLVQTDREQITKSMLGIVEPDPRTIVDFKGNGPGRIT